MSEIKLAPQFQKPGPIFWVGQFAWVIGILLFCYVAGLDATIDAGESGPIENLQLLVLLALCGVLIATIGSLMRQSDDLSQGLSSLGILALGIVVTMIGREVSWGQIYDVSSAVETSLKIANFVGLVALVTVSAMRFNSRVHAKKAVLSAIMLSRFFGWGVFAIILLICSVIVEQDFRYFPRHMFYEEMLELMAYLSAMAATLTLWRARAIPSQSEAD